jgi:DNA-binding CsgD family transcriptional regulator
MHEFRLGREAMDNPMRLMVALMNALKRSLDLLGMLDRVSSRSEELGEDEGLVMPLPAGLFACHDEPMAGFAGGECELFAGTPPDGGKEAEGKLRPCQWMYRRYFDPSLQQEQTLAMLWGPPTVDPSSSPPHPDNLTPPDWEKEALLLLEPMLASVVCKSYALSENLAQSHQLVEALSRNQSIGSILVKPSAGGLTCSARATVLLEKWFPQEQGTQSLPKELHERLELLATLEGGKQDQHGWSRMEAAESLKVSFVPLSGQGVHRAWVLLLEEVPLGVPLPRVWHAKLTKREAEVVECALQYLDNRDIADQLKCTEATVKKHLQRAFEKLGVENRNMLLYWAVRR